MSATRMMTSAYCIQLRSAAVVSTAGSRRSCLAAAAAAEVPCRTRLMTASCQFLSGPNLGRVAVGEFRVRCRADGEKLPLGSDGQEAAGTRRKIGGRRERNEAVVCRAAGGGESGEGEGELEVAVFRFTLGIPGVDDSDIPRIVGLIFLCLLLLNHWLSPDYPLPAQTRSEVVALALCLISLAVPTIDRRIKEGRGGRSSSASSDSQIFVLPEGLDADVAAELAWVSYAILRNTNASSVLVVFKKEVLCFRGSWAVTSSKKSEALRQIQEAIDNDQLIPTTSTLHAPFSGLFFPVVYNPSVNSSDVKDLPALPSSTSSLMVIPFNNSQNENDGFVLIACDRPRGLSVKDRALLVALASKVNGVLLDNVKAS